MLENTAAMPSQSAADSAPMRRRIARVDGRSKTARRVKELAANYVAHGAEPRAALRTAELQIIAADMRAKQLRGDPVDMAALLKAEGYADRAERALGTDKREPAHIPLRERLLAETEQAG